MTAGYSTRLSIKVAARLEGGRPRFPARRPRPVLNTGANGNSERNELRRHKSDLPVDAFRPYPKHFEVFRTSLERTSIDAFHITILIQRGAVELLDLPGKTDRRRPISTQARSSCSTEIAVMHEENRQSPKT